MTHGFCWASRDGIFKGTAARIERLRFFWREEGLSDEAAINQLIEKVSAADGSLADTVGQSAFLARGFALICSARGETQSSPRS